MYKVFISPENRGGGHGPYTGHPGIYERDVCHKIADALEIALARNGFDPIVAEYGSSMESRVGYANTNGVNYYICVHTNAGGGTGTECLYYNHPHSIKANQMVYDELVKLYPSKRGLKDRSTWYENANTKMVSCYVEVAFHDNPEDANFILNNIEEIAEAMCKGICEYFGVIFKPKTVEPPVDSSRIEELLAEKELLQSEIDLLRNDVELLDGTVKGQQEQIQSANEKLAEMRAALTTRDTLITSMRRVFEDSIKEISEVLN